MNDHHAPPTTHPSAGRWPTRWSRRRALALGAAGLAAAALAAMGCKNDGRPGGSRGLDTVRLALDWTPNTNHTGFFVAQQQGWYREAGIAFDPLPYAKTSPEVLVGAGKAHFGISFEDSMVFARAAGEPIVSAMAVLQHTPAAIAVKRGRDDIKSPKDLDGKIYAGYGGPTEVPTLRAMIKHAGGKGVFDVVSLGTSAYEALYAGKADFAIPFITWEGIEAELRNEPLKYFRYTDHGFPDHYGCIMVANEQWIARHPDLAKRFVQATVRGFTYAAQHPDEAVAMLMAANPGAFTLPELPKRSARLLAREYYLDAQGKFGTQTLEKWVAYPRFLYAAGVLVDGRGKPLTKEPDWSTHFTSALV